MRIKLLILPVALVIPILLALSLLKPSTVLAPEQAANESNSSNMLTPKVATTHLSTAPRLHMEPVIADNFDSALALTLLSEIALDDDGAPIINNALKQQLDNAAYLIGRERSPAELDQLSELISQAFKPQSAHAIKTLLLQYHAYKMAEQDYATAINHTSPADISNDAKIIASMRNSYLGHDVAEKLFGEENIYHDYMVELTERLDSSELSETARNNIVNEVQKKYYPHQQETEEL